MTDKAAEERGVNREKRNRLILTVLGALVMAAGTTAIVYKTGLGEGAPQTGCTDVEKRLTVLEARMDRPIKLEHKPLKVLVIYPDGKK